LKLIRNAQLSLGTVLGLGALLYLAWIAHGIRRGRRQLVP
jgi:hypothetical protein